MNKVFSIYLIPLFLKSIVDLYFTVSIFYRCFMDFGKQKKGVPLENTLGFGHADASHSRSLEFHMKRWEWERLA